jgi:hypothetical protein
VEVEFTLEQDFLIEAYRVAVSKMTREQAIAECVNLYRTILIREKQYQSLIGKEWGILDANP